MRLDPEEDVYYDGGTITCDADGNPALESHDFQWANLNDTSDITDGPVLTVTADMVDRSFSYWCQACNEYLGKTHCAISYAHFSVSGKTRPAD